MRIQDPGRVNAMFEGGSSLNARLRQLHDRLLESTPDVDRIACALYHEDEDILRTFINSTRRGEPLTGYEFRLADSESLLALARSGAFRVLDDIPQVIRSDSRHSEWLLEQGYRSSFTVPMYANGALLGFIFFDSVKRAAFSPRVQRDLVLYCNLINMTIANEMAAVRSVLASARGACDLAQLRDFETGAHIERMAHYSRIVARAVADVYDLSDEFVEHVFLFAPVHDIGKIGIPDRILLKQERLDPDERVIMETHVDKGREIIGKIIGDFGLSQLSDSRVMMNIVAHHHEFLDGSGYPAGLSGDQIPVEARIVAVADIFDALTGFRPYKRDWSVAEAMRELNSMANAGKLDVNCVRGLEENLDQVRAVMARYQDNW